MTLTEAAYWTKRLGVLLGGGLLVFIVAVLVITNLTTADPLPEFMKADYACTATAEEFRQHRLSIPSLSLGSGSERIYTIETATGRLEELPRIAYVYKYNNPGPSLDSQREAKAIARKLGLDENDIILRGGVSYDWPEDPLGRSLSVDVSTLNFNFKTNFLRSGSYPTGGELPTDPEAKSEAQSFLRGAGILFDDYASSEPQIVYINIEPNGTYSEARSKADAELIRVDFYRSIPFLSVASNLDGSDVILSALEQEYQNYESEVTTENINGERVEINNFITQIIPTDSQKGNISVYIGPEDERREDTDYADIYQIDYVGWIIDSEACGTYDLISATEVTTIIENGNASLIYLNEVGGDTVVPYTPRTVTKFAVNEVILAYLDTIDEQTYLQPIYIVIGEASLSSGITGKFYYYIPAINYDVIEDRSIETTTTTDTSNSIF